ncbi:MAG: crossover junction endodeoxyribonuclease RuvC [Candidatus Omnitrophica bacterium]|nr:crossover junction endodeoxyribonuclease RuvC [Candidatus Omnitrophota bacterium]MCF7894236.1 crossover junction endodeoxyribonuclease RuvC [Candidatus Omnitrophota bacterium]
MDVLAIDLGLRTCGYVICGVSGRKINLIKEGQIKPDPKKNLPEKLHLIYAELKKEIIDYSLKAIIVEKLYSHYRHPTTLGVLAQVKGIIALLAYQSELDYFQYPPTRARKAMLGKGNVDSKQVKKMAENMTGKKFKSVHTADAFSLVFAFSHTNSFKNKLFIQKNR